MIRDDTWRVSPSEAGGRLDMLLCRHYVTTTRAFCRQALLAKRILVNQQPREKGYKLRAWDCVVVEQLKELSDCRVYPNPAIPLDVVFEDASLLAFNKPAGMAVHPLSDEERNTLMNAAVARYPELEQMGDQPLMAGALHRIDTQTSGLVMAARSRFAFERLRAQFSEQTVRKIYRALVEGHVAVPGHLVHELTHQPGLPFCRMVDAQTLDGRVRHLHAETRYRPIALMGPDTLLEVTIQTGVTHQIRCQLALAGWPIVNDTRYGAKPLAGVTRHFLHAFALHFDHPVSGHPCCIQAQPPESFPKMGWGG